MSSSKSLRFGCILFLAVLPGCSYFRSKVPVMDTGYVIHAYDSPTAGHERKFGMFVPYNYNESRRKWPLILFLHGYGESGDDVELTRKHGPLKEGILRNNFPFLVVAPQCPKPKPEPALLMNAWRNLEPDVTKILDEVKRDYRVDTTRIYLTGLSMGGFGAFCLAEDWPDTFAAVAPVCGGGDASALNKCSRLPFWIFHGEKDHTVPYNRSVEMADALKAFGADVQITLYPDLAHDCWTATYSNDKLYAWFLSHKMEEKKKKHD